MSQSKSEVVTKYTLIGCVGGCQHRGEDIKVSEIVKSKIKPHPEYQSITVTPQCAKSAECGQRRYEIYQRADVEAGKMPTLKRRHNLWQKITAEYRDSPCPFYEAQ